MGVRPPLTASCTVPERGPDTPAPPDTALIRAEAAYAEAARAAALHAVGAEVLSTRQRVHALQRHWIPRLEQALARADLDLEQ